MAFVVALTYTQCDLDFVFFKISSKSCPDHFSKYETRKKKLFTTRASPAALYDVHGKDGFGNSLCYDVYMYACQFSMP